MTMLVPPPAEVLTSQLGSNLLGPGLHVGQSESFFEGDVSVCNARSIVGDLKNQVRRMHIRLTLMSVGFACRTALLIAS